MVTIRALTADDAAGYLAWRGGDAYKNEVIGRELAEHFSGRRVIFVAMDGDSTPVGTGQLALVHADPDLADGQGVAYALGLWVRDDLRGGGIGSGLMRAIEVEGVRCGCRRLTLMVEPDNSAALRLYERLGYERFKESAWVWRGKERPTLCMVKTLG